MKSNNSKAIKQGSIQCIEVLISRKALSKNLQWTLSVYSLENNPVRGYPAIANCDVFHFMNFDWNRTIRQLLEHHQVAYTVIQYFSSESIHADARKRELSSDGNALLSALDQMEETYGGREQVQPNGMAGSFAYHDSPPILDEKNA